MAEAVTQVFAPKRAKDAPNMLLAEAGTGIGKTLAYLAPASLWAEQAGGAVWVSTFTKALQRQLDGEGHKLFADPQGAGARRSSSARAARIISACSTSRTRCRARSRARGDPRATGRALGGIHARTATWSAATCPAGCRACSAAPEPPR